MRDNLMTLTSEERNPASMNLPHMSVAESTALMNQEDEACGKAVREVLPEVNETIEQCIAALRRGGRIIFTGAAHSGYLGMLDAYEANATFGTHGEFVSIVAGNFTDIMKTDGSAEDSAENGALDLQAREVTAKDFVIGISSGRRMSSARYPGAKSRGFPAPDWSITSIRWSVRFAIGSWRPRRARK